MSQNNENMKEKVVEEVTRNTSPNSTSMSAWSWSNKSHFSLQAEEDSEVPGLSGAGGSNEMTSQVVSFVDNADGEVIIAPVPINPVARVDNTDDLSLGAFLARPSAIGSFTWNTSTTVGVAYTIKPWSSFLSNSTIRKKIDNYAFFRGKLHIKVVVNGTPFQYGLMRCCYSPLLGLVDSKIRSNPTTNDPLLIPYSQQPGFFITPAANAGGQLELPFFYHTNWLDLTLASDVENMGQLDFVVYAPLGVAVAGGTTSVTVQIFAWAESVELMGSTTRLALQGDEYVEGPISSVASGIAFVSSLLTSIPEIEPFARATQIGASAVGAIAKVFGYTNVPVIADIHGYTPMNGPMLASANIGTPVQKLTLDPKQELSIDPSLHGLAKYDELSLPYLLRKESYFGYSTWSTSNTIDHLLLAVRVTPSLLATVDLNNGVPAVVGRRVYNTPTSYIGNLFKNWRGSMVLRIKVVATKFHKGRLKIQYDPRGDLTSAAADVNSVYTQIIDIGEEDDVELEIPYHQPYPWCYTDTSLNDNWNQGADLQRRDRVDNGMLTIRVLTTLSAPSTGAIRVLAFVRGGHDLEFANPKNYIGYEGDYTEPSFFELQAEDITSIVPNKYVVGTPSKPHPERYAQNFGEAIGSLRVLLHRYMTLDTVTFTNYIPDGFNVFGRSTRIMPHTPGFDPAWGNITQSQKVVGAGNANYCYASMTHVPYVSGMYLGYRGGMNYNFTPTADGYGPLSDIRFTRSQTIDNNANARWGTVEPLNDTASASTKAWWFNKANTLADSLGGLAITSTNTNNSLTAQVPDFKIANFSLVSPSKYVLGQGVDGTDRQLAHLRIMTRTLSMPVHMNLVTQISAAPDYTCLFWLCCPTLDFLKGQPTPV